MACNVVAIGGGHGLSATLRAVRRYADDICGVVTVGDDGGSTGRLRRAGWDVVPGDLRKSLVALAPPESLLAAGLEHRFEAGEVAGHTAGNLLLGAMMRECGGDLIAVLDALGEALGTVGRVLPAAVNPVTLLGETSEGWVRGQVEVASTTNLVRLGFEPADPMVPGDAVDAIVAADQVILGPGSLYTSVLAAAAVPGLNALCGSPGYLSSIVSQSFTLPPACARPCQPCLFSKRPPKARSTTSWSYSANACERGRLCSLVKPCGIISLSNAGFGDGPL